MTTYAITLIPATMTDDSKLCASLLDMLVGGSSTSHGRFMAKPIFATTLLMSREFQGVESEKLYSVSR